MSDDKKGIILLNLGGPDSLDTVKPFLYNLFSDREIIRLGPSFLQKPIAWAITSTRVKKTQEYYRLIGGRSPLLNITRAQAHALEEMLKSRGSDYKCFVGMRYWHPLIDETLENAVKNGIAELIALPLFPHYSKATTGSCFSELKRTARQLEGTKVTYVESWHVHPFYLRALVDSIKVGLEKFTQEERSEVRLLFSAHALPQAFVDEGDPYVDQVKATIESVARKLGARTWELAFQSKSGPVRWIGPETSATLEKLAKERVKNVLMVPISFVSDHIETLYEMDILYKRMAERLGVKLVRAPSLNTTPLFIQALADIVLQHAAKTNLNIVAREG